MLERGDDAAWLSLRNVDTIHVLAVDQLNTYDVLLSDDVIFTKGAYDVFVAGPATGKSVKAVATSTEAETLECRLTKADEEARSKKAEKPAEAEGREGRGGQVRSEVRGRRGVVRSRLGRAARER